MFLLIDDALQRVHMQADSAECPDVETMSEPAFPVPTGREDKLAPRTYRSVL
jgi:hypothetical protein